MNLEDLALLLKDSQKVAVLTGAGMSAESGVPTFRDPGGIWAKFRPEELASMDAFLSHPERVWEWYHMRRKTIYEVDPNPGHFALVELESMISEFQLITQNVDDLHNRAGQKNILELHGNLTKSYCLSCGEAASPEYLDRFSNRIPLCENCGDKLRPDIVWFGEMLDPEILSQSVEVAQSCDVFLVVGTSALVYPAAGLPLEALNNGAQVFEFNLEETALSHLVHGRFSGPCGESLPRLISLLK